MELVNQWQEVFLVEERYVCYYILFFVYFDKF